MKVYLGKTRHARFLPTEHAFEYPVVYAGMDLPTSVQQEVEEEQQSIFYYYYFGLCVFCLPSPRCSFGLLRTRSW